MFLCHLQVKVNIQCKLNAFSLLILYCSILDISVKTGSFLKLHKALLHNVCKQIINYHSIYGD